MSACCCRTTGENNSRAVQARNTRARGREIDRRTATGKTHGTGCGQTVLRIIGRARTERMRRRRLLPCHACACAVRLIVAAMVRSSSSGEARKRWCGRAGRRGMVDRSSGGQCGGRNDTRRRRQQRTRSKNKHQHNRGERKTRKGESEGKQRNNTRNISTQ